MRGSKNLKLCLVFMPLGAIKFIWLLGVRCIGVLSFERVSMYGSVGPIFVIICLEFNGGDENWLGCSSLGAV